MGKTEEMKKKWGEMSEEMTSGMTEWRVQHPEATFREIEEELDERMAEMRARMLSDAAMHSKKTEWGKEERPKCKGCGSEVQKRGKKKRTMQTQGGKEVELEREYGVCPKCGESFFPSGR